MRRFKRNTDGTTNVDDTIRVIKLNISYLNEEIEKLKTSQTESNSHLIAFKEEIENTLQSLNNYKYNFIWEIGLQKIFDTEYVADLKNEYCNVVCGYRKYKNKSDFDNKNDNTDKNKICFDLSFTNLTDIGHLFRINSNVTHIYIHDLIIDIPQYFFVNCYSLREIIIGSGVKLTNDSTYIKNINPKEQCIIYAYNTDYQSKTKINDLLTIIPIDLKNIENEGIIKDF